MDFKESIDIVKFVFILYYFSTICVIFLLVIFFFQILFIITIALFSYYYLLQFSFQLVRSNFFTYDIAAEEYDIA